MVTPFTSNAEQVGMFLDTLVTADQLTTPNYVKLRSRVVALLTVDGGYELLNQEINNNAFSVQLRNKQVVFWLVFTNDAEGFAIGIDYN